MARRSSDDAPAIESTRHVAPPSVVRAKRPCVPLTHATRRSTTLSPRSSAVVPLVCDVHCAPTPPLGASVAARRSSPVAARRVGRRAGMRVEGGERWGAVAREARAGVDRTLPADGVVRSPLLSLCIDLPLYLPRPSRTSGRLTADPERSMSSSSPSFPLLETERLRLRMLREDDFPVYATWCANPDVMRFLGGKTMSRVEAWRHMAFLVGHWQLRGYGYYALEEKATGRLVGRAGFTFPAGWPAFELGWTIAPECQRRGFATEAARTLLDHAFDAL